MGVTLDAGALIAFERGSREVAALIRESSADGRTPVVPAGALAQAWRYPSQVRIARLLAGSEVEPLDEASAKSAGILCEAAGTDDVVDASVVWAAARRRTAILTTDAEDLERLAAALPGSPGIRIIQV